ncbi:hypothetical protein [Gimesia fumaroli]|jgi:hypothetical protein|uniref:Uncharacterized protein n=1 Tax=Gimesia fumaroli TaxID=2527976 RepID=A0A518ID70_9PLAN|nr:hypothetical protein [Gimesia fumaroli]QDV51052.1 hypothetical protein Enr17x_31040 [Gimesia fumaroli]
MAYLPHAKRTGICLGLLLLFGCTSESEPILELSPSVTLISNGNPTEVYPISPEEQQKLLEEMLKYQQEKKRSTRP